MGAYVVRRLILAVPTLVLVLVVTFIMMRLAPGDPAEAFTMSVRTSEKQLAVIRHAMGLDQPAAIQFALYVGRAVRGEFGRSFLTSEPVVDMIRRRLPYTLELAAAATLLSALVGVPLGVVAAVRRNSPLDYATAALAVTVYSLPRFWLGLLLILLFAVRVPLFPVIGVGEEGNPVSILYHLVLPTLAIGLSRTALVMRMTRSAVLDVLREDFVRTARSKGLPERRVLFGHTLRNGLLPVLTVVGLGFGHLLGGSVIVEVVFARAGVGTLLVEGIKGRDYPVVQGTILLFAIGIVLANIAVDVLYSVFDPRVKYG